MLNVDFVCFSYFFLLLYSRGRPQFVPFQSFCKLLALYLVMYDVASYDQSDVTDIRCTTVS